MSYRARKGDWVLVVMAGVDPVEPRPHFVCKRCGDRHAIELPMRMDWFGEMGKAFVKIHKQCTASSVGTQVEKDA